MLHLYSQYSQITSILFLQHTVDLPLQMLIISHQLTQFPYIASVSLQSTFKLLCLPILTLFHQVNPSIYAFKPINFHVYLDFSCLKFTCSLLYSRTIYTFKPHQCCTVLSCCLLSFLPFCYSICNGPKNSVIAKSNVSLSFILFFKS